MLRRLGGGGGAAGVCARAAREPASAKDSPAMEQSNFFMFCPPPGRAEAHSWKRSGSKPGKPAAARMQLSPGAPASQESTRKQAGVKCVFTLCVFTFSTGPHR